jgi:CRP-like cAMP-binding protein
MSRVYRAGKPILSQGDAGDSLFVVQEGALTVHIKYPSGKEKRVADLGPGQFFGERLLLIGEPRGATVIPSVDSVVIEIGHAAISPLLKARPELMDFLSQILAERSASNNSALDLNNDEDMIAHSSVAGQILKQTRAFFGL